MHAEEFRAWAHQLVDWIADFHQNIEEYPVKSQVAPRQIYDQLPASAPEQGEDFAQIFADFQRIVLPGVTHWQSPNFFAYFPANGSFPSLLGEMLTTALGSQCMIWDTSPAAAELEERVMNWLRDAMALPVDWHGVIQDTASTATLTAILTAREKATAFAINQEGGAHAPVFRVYCSTETHSSIEKGSKIAGIGSRNVVKIGTNDSLAMRPDLLEAAIQQDLAEGKKPLCVVAALGTTGTTAIDPLAQIAQICQRYGVWLHVDAAYAGPLLLLPEYRYMAEGVEYADSFVFNPHKWMMVHFDCTAYFVKDKQALVNTFDILPEYLRTQATNVNNYKDWGIQLGRRFRALKLWFVLRSYGLSGIRAKLRSDNQLGEWLERQIVEHPHFELLAPRSMNLVCFRYVPEGITDEAEINRRNEQLLHALNATGKIYLTHTKVRGKYTLRLVPGQTNIEQRHVEAAWALIVAMTSNN